MNDYVTITYVGRTPGFAASVKGRKYEFEWRKGLGIGNRAQEVRPDDAAVLARYRDKRGKKIFLLEKFS